MGHVPLDGADSREVGSVSVPEAWTSGKQCVRPAYFGVMPSKKAAKPRTQSWESVRRMARALPGVEDVPSYGTPGLKVKGKLVSRLKEDGVIVMGVGTLLERDWLLEHDPRVFYITDHYRDYPAVLVRLDAVSEETLRDLLVAAWRRVAPKKLLAEFDAGPGPGPSRSRGQRS